MTETAAATNGSGEFDVGALVNLIVPFEFPYEGSTLKGRWYKYKTTTPEYARQTQEQQNQRIEKYLSLENQIQATKDRRAQARLLKEKQALDEQYQRTNYAWLADAIVEWNATDKGQPIPVDVIRLDSFPLPFMLALAEHLEASRHADKNPTSSDSLSGD